MARLILVIILFSMKTIASSTFDGARLGMRHVDFGRGFTKDHLVARSALSSYHLSLHYVTSQYMIDLSIGSPVPQPISAIADTGSDVIWTQCYNCTTCFAQPTPLYDPRKSGTYSPLPCNSNACLNIQSPDTNSSCSYEIIYGSGHTEGVLISHTFLLRDNDPVSVENVVFGCGLKSTATFGDTTGIIGLSRSKYSLISQMELDRFSYCIQADVNSINPMFLGSAAVIDSPLVQYTPFVAPQESKYFISLIGISLGSTLLQIPQTLFEFNPQNQSGGVIIDSGTPITRLVPQAFAIVSQALQSTVNLPIVDGSRHNLKLCFALPSGSSPPSMPDMIFHFDGADLKLPMDKYMYQTEDGQLFCLLMLEPAGGFTESIIGTRQMQNMHVLYDLKNNMLSFAPVQCDKL